MSSHYSQSQSHENCFANGISDKKLLFFHNGNYRTNQSASISNNNVFYPQIYQYPFIYGTIPQYLLKNYPLFLNDGVEVPFEPTTIEQEALIAQSSFLNPVTLETPVDHHPVSVPVAPTTIVPKALIVENNGSPVNRAEYVQKKHRNGIKSKKRSSNKNLSIFIKSFNIGKDEYYQIIDESVHDVYYNARKVSNGEVKGCINYASVLKIISGIKYMSVITIDDKKRKKIMNIEYDLEGNESNEIIVPLKTNGKCKETGKKRESTVMLTFKDENKVVRLRIYLKLRDSKTERRRINNELKIEKKSKNCKALEIINGFIENYREENEETLVNSIRFALKVMLKTLLNEVKKEISDEKMDYLMDNYNKLYDNPENKTYAKFKNIIFTVGKNDERKKELLKLCFDALYNNVMGNSIDNSEQKYFDNPAYIKFVKEYFIRDNSRNDIVITKDIMELKGRKRKSDSINDTEELQKRKKQKIDMDGNITLRINK